MSPKTTPSAPSVSAAWVVEARCTYGFYRLPPWTTTARDDARPLRRAMCADLSRVPLRITSMKRAILGVLVVSCLLSTAAYADGLPVLGLDGRTGVLSADGAYRFVSFVSARNTVVARLHVDGAGVARYRTIAGSFMVPAAAYDNSASGLSADGRTLVLIRPRTQLGQRHTHLVVLDATRLRVKRRVVLRG